MKIYNLTNHEMTSEQIDALQKMFPYHELDVSPQGEIFNSMEDRMKWVDKWVEILSPKTNFYDSHSIEDVAVIGGDTAAFSLLLKKIFYDRGFSEGRIYEGASTFDVHCRKKPTFVFADTDRIQDENNRFIFVFKRFLVF